MKKALFTFIMLFGFVQIHAQSITNITYSPSNPTPLDTIYFYVDVVFPSSGCPLANSGSSVVGQTVNASALHCKGVLSAICNATDTFQVLPLTSGAYSFDMTLSSGSGPIPCSPGFVPDDNRAINFTVSTITNISQTKKHAKIEVGPNPSTGLFKLANLKNSTVIVYDILGNELIKHTNLSKNFSLDLSNYTKGVYLMKTVTNGKSQSFRLLKK